jgi:hypothetical protein
MIINIHTREINASLPVVGAILGSLASNKDLLWPYEKWLPMLLDRPLSVGATGGHGEIRYFVESYEPGESVLFRFTAPQGFIGTHCFSLKELDSHTIQIKHEINMRLEGSAKISWPFIIRWLHDALVEDAFDKVEATITSHPIHRTWSLWVRFLRYMLGRDK